MNLNKNTKNIYNKIKLSNNNSNDSKRKKLRKLIFQKK